MDDSLPFLGSVDVAVMGGGVAGAALALTLLRYTARSVAIIESGDYGVARVGENVSSALLSQLEYLGVEEPFFEEVAYHENFSILAAWGHDTPVLQHSLRHWSGEGYLLDRGSFDVMLASAVQERGGKFYLVCHTESLTPHDEQGYWLHVRHASRQRFALHARFVVDATGRKANIARRLGAADIRYDALIGICRFFDMNKAHAYPRDIVIESVRDGWWYSAPLPDHRMVVTLMTDVSLWQQAGADKITHWQKLLKQAPHTHTRLAQAAIAADAALTLRPAHTHRLERSFGKDWLATGDAVASFDPLSSLGIGFAIHSACHAALAVDHYLETGEENALQHYHKGIVTQHADYLQHWRTFYAYERRFPDAAFWQRSLQPR